MKNEDFQKLKELVESRLKINDDNVMNKSLDISNIQIEILKIHSKEFRLLKIKQLDKDKVYGELYHFYKFKFDHSLDSKSEIDTYIRADDKFYQIALEISQQEIQVNFLEKTLEMINTMGYKIKNYVDLQKISKGLI